MDRIQEIARRVGPLDATAMRAARARQDQLTRPTSNLGRLEGLSVKLAGITGQARPHFPRKAVIVLAGDHGVVSEGVSADPIEVTTQLVANLLAGGSAINVLARRVGARVVVADLGLAADVPNHSNLINRKIWYGTQNMVEGPAMSYHEAVAAITAGVEILEAEIDRGLDVVATGDVGIGNATAAGAIVATITGRPAAAVTGRETGLDDACWAHAVEVIEQACALNRPNPADPLDVLATVGGYEIGGLVGVILAAAAHRRPVIIDGFISSAAALLATELCPRARDYLIAARVSHEVGHRIALERLDLVPLLDLDLRLGEGTDALVAMHLIDDAVAMLDEMATCA